ncbi:MAG: hypothetical protein ACLFVW_06140, partial [Phycisphaerae bacterium]
LALGLTLWSTVFKRPGGSVSSDNPQFKCTECEHEFEVESIPADQRRDAGDPSMVLLDCPSCGEESTAMRMIECPDCGEYYISQRTKYFIEHGRPAPSDVRDVCPHCGTDRLEYMRSKRKNR